MGAGTTLLMTMQQRLAEERRERRAARKKRYNERLNSRSADGTVGRSAAESSQILNADGTL